MINIGTNFLYRGPLFLDDRHGMATSLEDLRNWSIPVPDGFEVFLNLENDPAWYTYNSGNPVSADTGYFRKRLDQAYVDSKIADVRASMLIMNQQINNLWNSVREIQAQIRANTTLEITSSNGGKYDPNSYPSIDPEFSWVLKSFGSPIDIQSATDVLIDGNSIGKVLTWRSPESISQSRTYELTVIYQERTLTQTISYIFEPYTWFKYFGTYSGTTLSNINNLSPSTPVASGWGTGSVAFSRTVDCTGGVYPYYVFPSSLYNQNTFKMYIDGFRTTDFVSGSLTISGTPYTTIRTGYIQTGTLQMRYE